MWILALVAANIGIFFLERTYRTIDTSGWTMETFLYVALAVTVSQVALYKGFALAPSLIFAGGDWEGFRDRPHVELPYTTWQELRPYFNE